MFDFNSTFDFGIGDFRRAPPHGYVNQGSDFVRPYDAIWKSKNATAPELIRSLHCDSPSSMSRAWFLALPGAKASSILSLEYSMRHWQAC